MSESTTTRKRAIGSKKPNQVKRASAVKAPMETQRAKRNEKPVIRKRATDEQSYFIYPSRVAAVNWSGPGALCSTGAAREAE